MELVVWMPYIGNFEKPFDDETPLLDTVGEYNNRSHPGYDAVEP